MDSIHDEKRMNVESDKLSSLSDDLIHKILSFISLQQAIETSALSSRWRYIWTSMPYLDFSTEGFQTFNNFYKFVTHVLSRRDTVLSLEKVGLSISHPHEMRDARRIVSLLRQFRTVKYLTVNLEIVEEIRAHKLIKELQGLLNQWKANSDNNTAHADQGRVENQRAQQETIMESQFGERLSEIKRYWSDLNKWSEEGNKRTCRIILMLREIESLLIELPVSQRARMQPMYSSMYAEADTFMDNMMDCVRIQCHKKPRVIVSFYRIAAFGVKSELDEIMDYRLDKKRMNVEGDRLSSLPDDLIHQILSSISLQQAIKISTLSSRWRYIWTSMPYLDFSTEGFLNFKKFSKFVTCVLSRRDNQVQLSSANLSFHKRATQRFVRNILNYVFSRNLEQLSVVSFQDKIPVNLFSSQSLKHLMLTQKSRSAHCTLTSTWYLPSLTTLYLDGITLTEVNGGDFLTNCTI